MLNLDLTTLDRESLDCLAYILAHETTALDHEAPQLARSLMICVRHELQGRDLGQQPGPQSLVVEDPDPAIEGANVWCEQVLSRSRGAGGFEDLTELLNGMADDLRSELRRRRAH